jgi:hypothetical protein
MEIKLTKTQLRTYLRERHGLDLSGGKVQMITNKFELPMEFHNTFTPSSFNTYLNHFGPMYYLKGKKNSYLGQERDGEWRFYDNTDSDVNLNDVYKDVGIPKYLGMRPEELAELYEE